MTRVAAGSSVSKRPLSTVFSWGLDGASGLSAQRRSISGVALGVSDCTTFGASQLDVPKTSLQEHFWHRVKNSVSKNPHGLKSKLLKELKMYSIKVCPTASEILSWPKIVLERWNYVNRPKAIDELAVLSWNTNGRLNLREV